MRASEIHEHLCSLDGGWVDWEQTTDRIVAGDPDTEVRGIAVGWMSYRSALQRALELGCNCFVTHEPTFFSGHDDEERIFRFPGVQAKREWIGNQGMVIIRCHDVWDQLPGLGIPDSWARFLSLDHRSAAEGYYRLFAVTDPEHPPLRTRTARGMAEHVASRVAEFGQPAVELVGPADASISLLALGTGAITPFTRFVETYDADIAICTDDGFTYWHAGTLAIDLGIPVIVVNHAVSEIPGVQSLARHLEISFPQVPVRYIPQGCMYELVGG